MKKQAGDVIKIVAFSFWLGFLELLSLLFHFCFFSFWNGNYLMFLWVVNGFWWVKFWSFWQWIWVDQQSWWVRTEQIGGRRMAGAQGTTVQESLNGKLFFLLVKGWAGPGLTDRIVSFWAIFFLIKVLGIKQIVLFSIHKYCEFHIIVVIRQAYFDLKI